MTVDSSSQDVPYTNREIREKWHDISNDLQEIIIQTKKTNGSVADLNRWRERVNGGAMAAGAISTLCLIPILYWMISTLVHLPETINDSINKALSAYDLTIK